MSARLSAELIRLLGIKKGLLNELLASLGRSVCLLREDDMDAFDTEMDICQQIAAKVDELHRSLDPIKAQATPAMREETAVLESGIADILKRIDEARKECNDVAEQKLHTYGQQIKTIRHTKKGIDGYTNQFVKRDAAFIDAKK